MRKLSSEPQPQHYFRVADNRELTGLINTSALVTADRRNS